MDPTSLRNFKDFLLQYNKISEQCFNHCVNDLTARDLTWYETNCVEKCTHKYVKTNNKAMQVYMEVQTVINQRRTDEFSKQAELQNSNKEVEMSDKEAVVSSGEKVEVDVPS